MLAAVLMLAVITPGAASPIIDIRGAIGDNITGTFRPGEVFTFDLHPSMFHWDGDRPSRITLNDINESYIRIRTSNLPRDIVTVRFSGGSTRASVVVTFADSFGTRAGSSINGYFFFEIDGDDILSSLIDIRGTLSTGGSISPGSSTGQTNVGGIVLPPPSGAPGTIVAAPPVSLGGAITENDARTRTATAVQSARASGATVAAPRFLDASSVSGAVLRASHSAAGDMPVNFIADTMSGNAVMGRITINPADSANISGSINLGVFTDGRSTLATRSTFEKWYTNRFQVISLAQKSDFGMTVRVAAMVDLTGIDTNNLVVYAYNAQANTFKLLTDANASIDSNGFLRFSTDSGGEIIITDRVLARR
jgi:hypothetical protein